MRLALTGHLGYVGTSLLSAMRAWTDRAVVVPTGELTLSAHPIPCDVVVHAAGGRRSSGRPLRKAHIEPLLATLRRVDPGASVILISSRAVYGQAVAEPVHEGAPVAPDDDYGQAKTAAEFLLRDSGRRAIVLRPSAITGPNVAGAHNPDEALARMVRSAIRSGEVAIPPVDREIDPVYVEDVVEVVRLCLHDGVPWGTVLNVPGPRVSVHELASAVADHVRCQVGHPCDLRPKPFASAFPLLDGTRMKTMLNWAPQTSVTALIPRLVGCA